MKTGTKIIIISVLFLLIGTAIGIFVYFYMKSKKPVACNTWTGLSDCSKASCIDSDTKCVWDTATSACSCPPPPPPPPKACRDWTSQSNCTKATCINSKAKCSWDTTTSACSCPPPPPPPPKACSDWTFQSNCTKATCIDSEANCYWDTTTSACSCSPPPKACSDWTFQSNCTKATCIDSETKCSWDTTSGTCSCSPWKDLYVAYPGYAIMGRPVVKSFTAKSLDDCLQQAYAGDSNDGKPFPSVDWNLSSKNCQLSMDTKDTVPESYKTYEGQTYYQYTPKIPESFTVINEPGYIPYIRS